MRPHAFIAMPYGRKTAGDGSAIDFNRVHDELLRPALQQAGFESFRADEEQRAGSIHKDMFQELLVADLVLVDLSIDNPNVWYELGVRHALRARGVVLVQAAGLRDRAVFDTTGERKAGYRLKDGAPDPATLQADIDAIAAMARETLQASARRTVSPVYAWLPQLREPEWRSLLMADDNEFGSAYQAWRERIEVARQKQRAGDILVLADETPTQALWLEARREAGSCLLSLRQYGLALEQFDAALALDPEDLAARRQRIVCLGQLGQHEEAHVAAQALTADWPGDAQAWSLAGHAESRRWQSRWRRDGATPAELRAAAQAELASLQDAVEPYHRAFVADPAAYGAGIRSLTLHLLLRDLGATVGRALIDNLIGGVLWASLSAQERDRKDYRARAAFAELCLLVNPLATVQAEFRNAVAAADGDAFALDSTRQAVQLLRDLAWRPTETDAALQILDAELARLAARQPARVPPRQVFVFSGHMVDAPTRPKPRFPRDKVGAAEARIREVLDKYGAGPEDLALTQGAAGGDLLFVEACQARGVRAELLLPLAEPAFIERSVRPSSDGDDWVERYYAVKARLAEPPRVMPAELGAIDESKASPFERCNLWLLYSALAFGPDKVRLVTLWDGGGSDGPGGTRHMVEEVRRHTGRVSWIDARTL